MKRSQIINTIAYDIINADADLRAAIGNPNNDYMTKEWAESVAEYVLAGLERENMLPPKTNKDYTVTTGITASKEVNEWDHE